MGGMGGKLKKWPMSLVKKSQVSEEEERRGIKNVEKKKKKLGERVESQKTNIYVQFQSMRGTTIRPIITSEIHVHTTARKKKLIRLCYNAMYQSPKHLLMLTLPQFIYK